MARANAAIVEAELQVGNLFGQFVMLALLRVGEFINPAIEHADRILQPRQTLHKSRHQIGIRRGLFR